MAFPITLQLKPTSENNLMDLDRNSNENNNNTNLSDNQAQNISDMNNNNMTVEQLISNNNTNTSNHLQIPQITHASVLDFTAPENTAYLPYRVFCSKLTILN